VLLSNEAGYRRNLNYPEMKKKLLSVNEIHRWPVTAALGALAVVWLIDRFFRNDRYKA
jgi:hypothetical protein